jgi:DNA polymerase-3 subunit alpha
MATLPEALRIAEQQLRDEAAGQNDLFGMGAPVPAEAEAEAGPSGEYCVMPEWNEDDRLAAEKETLGLYLTGHPIDQYEDELAAFVDVRLADLKPEDKRTAVLAGLIMGISVKKNRRGDRFGVVTLDDRTGRIEMMVFAEAFERYRDLLAKDRLVVVEGEVAYDDFSGGMRVTADAIMDIEQARSRFARRLVIGVGADKAGNGFVRDLAGVLEPFREGECPIWIDYRRPDARAALALGERWRVRPTDELIHRLRDLAGEDRVRLDYRRPRDLRGVQG